MKYIPHAVFVTLEVVFGFATHTLWVLAGGLWFLVPVAATLINLYVWVDAAKGEDAHLKFTRRFLIAATVIWAIVLSVVLALL